MFFFLFLWAKIIANGNSSTVFKGNTTEGTNLAPKFSEMIAIDRKAILDGTEFSKQ